MAAGAAAREERSHQHRSTRQRARIAAPSTEAGVATSIDLTTTIAAVVDAARGSYPGRILFDATPARASIAPGTLHRLLWLVLEQAMRSSGDEGTLRVSVSSSGPRARVVIEHQRPGPHPMDPDHGRVLEMLSALVHPVGGAVRHTTLDPFRSVVEIDLPVRRGTSAGGAEPAMPRVLLVQGNCRLIADALRVVMVHRGYSTVDVAPTVEDTVALALRGRYDVCVVDLGAAVEGDLLPALRRSAPAVRVVLLRDVASPASEPRGADVVAVTCPVDDILAVIERGVGGPASAPAEHPDRRRPSRVDEQSLRWRYSLTAREEEVLVRLGKGERTSEIASHMNIKVSTARTHIQSVLMKLRVHSKLEAVARVAREGGFDPGT